jgi:hypothetical protein
MKGDRFTLVSGGDGWANNSFPILVGASIACSYLYNKNSFWNKVE